ncbi:MAG: 3,5-cyclic-AMP phosphodiesterase [Actinomycetota bacterium]
MLIALDDMPRAYAQTSATPALPINLELVTLTETSAIITWFTGNPTQPDSFGRLAPVPADTQVLLGKVGAAPSEVFYDATPTPYHYVELHGLEPGATYVCAARSGGIPAIPAVDAAGNPLGTSGVGALTAGPGLPIVFTTPQPPPGDHLFTIALCNDMHLGETVAGLITTQGGVGLPPGISQVPGRPPYAELMAAALSKETRERGADVLLVAGDVTSEAAQVDVHTARSYLDAFGAYGSDYFVARGNHDRAHDTAGAAACHPSTLDPAYHDCFRDEFFANDKSWFAAEKFGLRMLGLDTYDTIGNGSFAGSMGGAQFDFVRSELARAPDQPTIVFGHHPVPLDATLYAVPPVVYGLDNQQARELEQLYAAHPGVFLHHAGHTHRNKRAISTTAPGVMFQEVAAVKEYPGGFHLMRVHTGGYATNFYKFRDTLAQEWSERSRPEVFGLSPLYTFGNTNDRNSVVVRDLSGLQSAAAARAAKSAPQRVDTIPATAATSEGLIAGAAAAAAASAANWLRRKSADLTSGE